MIRRSVNGSETDTPRAPPVVLCRRDASHAELLMIANRGTRLHG